MQRSPAIRRDIVILICTRARPEYLARLLRDIDVYYAPALENGGMTVCTFIYAQAYTKDFLDGLRKEFSAACDAGRLILIESAPGHGTIGEVFSAAISALHERVEYRLAMLMDDDSLYRLDPVVDENLRRAARAFLDNEARAYSIKLGQSRMLEFQPFINVLGPIMPFKEKMLWVSREVMTEACALPRFAELSVGEDVVLAALAWRGAPDRCFGVFGIATFLHLGFEPDDGVSTGPIAGGYGDLVGYDEVAAPDRELGKYGAAFRSGVVPYSILPEIFVGPDHPHHTISGIRPDAIARFCHRSEHLDRPGEAAAPSPGA